MLALCGAAGARAADKPPTGLHAFLLRSNEVVTHTFSRTPSFGWNPVPGARRYQFELATGPTFSDNSIVWSTKNTPAPTVAVPISLPWITGQPFSLYAHVRAVTRHGPSRWSAPFGFNMRWPAVPAPIRPDHPGLIRWTPVPGANGYSVWMQDPTKPSTSKIFTTRLNMADEREYYTFHPDAAWTSTVVWRVRAMRLALRDDAERPPDGFVRPVEPGLHQLEPGSDERTAGPALDGHERRLRRGARSDPRVDASLPLRRRHAGERDAPRPLARRGLHRLGLPQPGLPRRGHREPGVRPARLRPAGDAGRRDERGKGVERLPRERRRARRPHSRRGHLQDERARRRAERRCRQGRPLGQQLGRRPLLLDGHARRRDSRRRARDRARRARPCPATPASS